MSSDDGIIVKEYEDGTWGVLHYVGDSAPIRLRSFDELRDAVEFATDNHTEYGISFKFKENAQLVFGEGYSQDDLANHVYIRGDKARIEQDRDGELVIYTGLYQWKDGKVYNRPENSYV